MKLTNDDKARLATELCGLVVHKHKMYPSWIIHPDDYKKRRHIYNFDPVNNGQHTLLVLEGLRKRVDHIDIRLGKGTGPTIIKLYNDPLDVIEDNPSTKLVIPGTFASAVVTAGLEVLNQKGGE